MGSIRMLDCTLRDGAYIVNGRFGVNAISGIVKKLGEANVEIVECGWLKDPQYTEGSTYYHLPSDSLPFLGENKKAGTIYTVMIDWDRYDLSQLPECDMKSIDGIRIVFPRGHYKEAIPLGNIVKAKGYKLFFQAANTLGYTDDELLEMVSEVNKVRPDGLAVVDTFGAMYEEDMRWIVSLVNRHLEPSIALGLHSHNNLQQSFLLSMSFAKLLADSTRDIIIDSSLSGMGRGAGNAPTELVANYLNRFYGKNYDINAIVDVIDTYMASFSKNYTWGYSTAYFLSGMYCSHVNNIAYLTEKHKTRNKDIKQILEALPKEKRLVYDYDLLEEKYVEYQQCNVNDEAVRDTLRKHIQGQEVLLIAPGVNAVLEKERVRAVEEREELVTIGVNAVVEGYKYDYLFFTNPVRLMYALEVYRDVLENTELIFTSNLLRSVKESSLKREPQYINYNDFVVRGWVHFENSVIMCLRLIDKLDAASVYIAGFDGYSRQKMYADALLHSSISLEEIDEINEDIGKMLEDFQKHSNLKGEITLVTTSYYAQYLTQPQNPGGGTSVT